MKHIRCRNLAVAMAAVLSVGAVQAQTVMQQSGSKADAPIPVITDWSSRSVVYPKPKMPDEFARNASGDAEMARLYRDPRYTAQLMRRIESELPLPAQRNTLGSATVGVSASVKCDDRRRGHCGDSPAPGSQASSSVLRDWSNVLGGGANGQGGSGIDGVFPAKYNFNITAEPSCANDFVVYTTNAAGVTASGAGEYWEGTFADDPGTGQVVIGLAGPRRVTLIASTTVNSGLNFSTSGTNSQRGDNLRNAVNRWTSQTGFTATGTGATVRITSNTTSSINNGSVSESLNGNFNFTRTGGSGTAGQPTLIAFNQLYQGVGEAAATGPCNGAWNESGTTKAPKVMWSYNTGTNYVTETSPTLSYYDNGKQVAFVQRNGNDLQLVLLKWKEDEGSPGAPASAPLALSAADYRGDGNQGNCTATTSCMYVINFLGTDNVDNGITYSAPYVDYVNDTAWVGDGNGRLHKFTGIFEGQPAEAGGNFPAQVIAGNTNGIKLSSPVEFDGDVYIGSQSGGAGVGGKLHRVNSTTGTVVSSVKLANDNTTGLRESIIASYAPTATGGSIYAFLFNDGTAGDGATCDIAANNNNACRVVARFTPGFAASSAPAQRAYVGRGNSTNSTLYAGAFNEDFYASGNGTGAMYIVGGDLTNTFQPALWRIPLNGGVMQTPQRGPNTGPVTCTNGCVAQTWNWSPVTMVKNGVNEYLYFSMPSNGGMTGCSGACLYMLQLNDLNGNGTPNEAGDATWGTTNAARAALAAPGGTGGITYDNTRGETGSSQIYFSQSGAGGNAIQATQSGLQ